MIILNFIQPITLHVYEDICYLTHKNGRDSITRLQYYKKILRCQTKTLGMLNIFSTVRHYNYSLAFTLNIRYDTAARAVFGILFVVTSHRRW